MFETLDKIDTQIFLSLNGMHSSFLDFIMWYASKIVIWIPLYLWFLWLLYKEYPKDYWKVILSVAIMILITDQVADIAKNGVERLRPTHNPALAGMVHILRGYSGGSYGFFSGHAANSFAVATYISLMVGKRWKYIPCIAFVYAFLVSYSRIYLGVHYPGDVLTGALVGIITSFMIVKLFKYLQKVNLKQNIGQ